MPQRNTSTKPEMPTLHQRKRRNSENRQRPQRTLQTTVKTTMMTEKEHFQATKHYENPKIRYMNGHFITAQQLKELQVKE